MWLVFPVVPVPVVTAVPVTEGVLSVAVDTELQAAMTMVNINMTDRVVIFFILSTLQLCADFVKA